MYKNKSILAIIPARGGSKGIARKNIINVSGKPLIQYTIDSAKKSKYIDRLVVSTEDAEIASISVRCGAEVPFLRPIELAEDETKTVDVLIDVIKKLEELGCKYDYMVLLQPTQPLRQTFHIDEAIEMIIDKDEDSLVSVSEVREHPILMRTVDEKNEARSLLGQRSDIRRQDFSKVYKVNGAVYINRLNNKFNINTSLNDNKLAYIMDKKYDLDIDEPEDLDLLVIRLKGINR
ncbi:cytidylyltransferase domain-containing protein [Wansuia hejianensis]|uniref:Acylneuraminate cytidylyltransferase family protein n=1 Tax=Wansuia hejianensis TaxID=2763667 RepID=A0A926F1J4_9FIRM|nr:acylneuraminate cytidylyltransferase family protein [Wansuia hejianensis]MBC8590317.1 acylneuraminate cytidylyltransferase family protein [Wansuia hejianensis]